MQTINPKMDQEVKIEYFADAEQEALEKWISDYVNEAKVTSQDMSDEFDRRTASVSTSALAKWIRQEGILRLCQTLINQLNTTDSAVPSARVKWLHQKFNSKSSIEDQELVCKLMQVVDPFINPQLAAFNTAWAKHRNVCLVLSMIIDKCSLTAVKSETSNQLIDYLLNILDKNVCPLTEAHLWALMVVERLCLVPNRFAADRLPRLSDRLKALSANVDKLGHRFYKMDFDYMSYQVGFCAKWLLDNVLQATHPRLCPIKMLSEHLLARADADLFPPVRSAFPVTEGIYFYEVVLLTDGPVRIGWALKECDFEQNETEHLGDDEYSIALDGYSRCIWHAKKEYSVKVRNVSWKAGDVIGLLIDLDDCKFAFYLNGNLIHHKKKLSKRFAKTFAAFSAGPSPMSHTYCFAAASIGSHQQCFFNFGQQPFAYAPKDVLYSDFHTSSERNPVKYRLLETSLAGGSYWFKQELVDNVVEPLFQDNRQKDFNRWVKELESRIAVDDYDYEFLYGDLKWEFEGLMKDELAYIRLIQAIIRKMGTMVEEGQVDVVVGWIMYYLSSLDDTLSTGRDLPEIWFFDKSDLDSNGNSLSLPAPARFLEMIYPYMQLYPKCDGDVLKIRNTCIALSILVRKYWYLKDFLDEEVVQFVAMTLAESQDNTSLLFALICLDNLSMDQGVKERVLMNCHNLANLAKYLDQVSVGDVYDYGFDEVRYQLAFCARWCLDYVLVDDSQLRKPRDETRDSLNAESRTEHMKLSPDQLSARSDDGWQSVRSSFAVSTGVYYYEVLLLTSGPMRIGWATKGTDFYKTNVGDDKQSVGLDRYQRCVWHDADRFKIKAQDAWQAGDVIGCLIDVPNEKFVFYLNGKLIEYKKQFFKKVNFESESYYAAVTLWPHQQCFFNFGHAPFKFPPKNYAFRDFHSTSVSSSTNSSPSVNKHSILRRRIYDMFPSVAAKGTSSALTPPTIK